MGGRTKASISGDFVLRPPRLSDAGVIAGLAREYTRGVVGFADLTEDDVRNGLTEPGFDPADDARVVFDAAGAPVGYATATAQEDSDLVWIDVLATDSAVRGWLFEWTLDRARALGRARGHRQVTVDHGVYRADDGLRAEASAHGLTVVTTFHRMRIDHDGPVGPPVPSAGVSLRQGTDPAVREAAHAVLEAAFAEHFGHVPKPYDTWHDRLDQKSTFDWTQLWLAELDGRPAGALVCDDQFVADENCGYVASLGTLPDARGRGIAKYLLRHAFALDTSAGRAGTLLHVDSNNTTPALGVYESVGMRLFLVIDVWRRTLETA